MASVDKIKVGTTTYDVSPSKNGTLTGYTSNDAASPTAWSSVNAITTSDTNSSIFSKVTTMIKNVRWLYNKLGTTDFSSIGDGTVSGALSSLNSSLSGKAASSHSHTVSDLPVSNTQTNSTSYIPTSALVYSMQQQITSLNDALSNASGTTIQTITVTAPYTLGDDECPNIIGVECLTYGPETYYFASVTRRRHYTTYYDEEDEVTKVNYKYYRTVLILSISNIAYSADNEGSVKIYYY